MRDDALLVDKRPTSIFVLADRRKMSAGASDVAEAANELPPDTILWLRKAAHADGDVNCVCICTRTYAHLHLRLHLHLHLRLRLRLRLHLRLRTEVNGCDVRRECTGPRGAGGGGAYRMCLPFAAGSATT